MAEGTKLQLKFEAADGRDVTFNYNYAKPSATAGQVKALMQSMITNNTIFERPPVAMKSAKTITTTETAYDLSVTADPNSRGIPVFEAYKRGILVDDEDFDINDYDENGKLKDTSGPMPENLRITAE